jgi:acetyl-CoA synthetase
VASHNVGYLCTGRQCELGLGEKTALRWVSAKHEVTQFSFAELDLQSSRFANVLRGLGLERGDVVCTYLPRCPEQFFTVLGALKCECLTATLFSNFGPAALLDRLADARAKVVVTTRAHALRLKPVLGDLPALRHLLLIDVDRDVSEAWLSYPSLMARAAAAFATPDTPADARSILHYTSGSTGKPKGVVHSHGGLAHISATTRQVLGLRPDDLFWCTADQGWVTGTSYGILGPWALGVTQLHFGGGFDPKTWLDLLQDQGPTVWYTAPTALRMLMREPDAFYTRYSLPRLRSILSVGEPLNPEVLAWARRALHKDVYDTWFQTETGGIIVANHPGLEIRPGSMGVAVDGVRVAIVAPDGGEAPNGTKGRLCIEPGWASMFVTYLNNEAAYQDKFRDGWYASGDMAWRDEAGYFWFVGRDDDVINTSGHLVSPFDVESCLLELPEVDESGVVGVPDETLFEKVIAFVRLRQGLVLDPQLVLKIRSHVARRLSSVAMPQDVVAVAEVPKTKSGKIVRRYLRAQYLGQDCGDLSTLDSD